jgi:2',3'-cyclic-nucleotide 2'-phosphodiesterase (5'-nucleotidase family)
MPDIRLLLTNDFFGSFATQVTSWGTLPGGDALRAEVDRLREGARASAWVDVGDFAGGGPLAPATDGELSWAAAAKLGFDAAIPGNHEFDLGAARLE